MPAGAVALGLRVVLAGIALGGLYGGGWLSVAPNRLLPGEALPATAALGPWAHVVAAALLAYLALAAREDGPEPTRFLRFGLLAGLLLVLAVLTGLAAGRLLEGRPPSARCMAGAGLFTTAGAIALLLLYEARALRPARIAWIAAGAAAAFALARRAGAFEALSIMVEYRARADLFHAAFLRHLALSAAALALALLVSVPLGWVAFRRPRLRGAVEAVLNGVQVVPAVALFGLLVSLLSLALAAWPSLRALGLAAIGPTPALIAVAAYLMLPLTRAMATGLSAANPAAIEAARGMGMSERRIALDIRLPLGLPVFVAGLRVAAVQAVGLTTLGALIGAGGLGAIVFEGMAQFASDLIILGSAPIVGLAMLADLSLRAIARRLARPLS